MNPGLIKSYVAGGAIKQFAPVKFGGVAGQVVEATAAADLVVGICYQPGGAASGQRVDVVLSGAADALFGGVVAAGAKVVAGAGGTVVAAAPAAGANAHVLGIALVATASGDVAPIFLSQSVMQG